MKISYPKVNYRDKRGEISDILIRERIDYVTLITSRKGATRGNHYHKKTIQWAYLLQGKLKILTQMPGKRVRATVAKKGALIVNEALERHALIALEDTVMMVCTRGLRGGRDFEKDTYRLSEPLKE